MSERDWFFIAAIAVAIVANGFWRMLGVILAARVDERSAAFAWVRMVATALVAALVCSLVLHPPGALATVPLWIRLGSILAGVAGYALARRSVAIGILAGEAVLVGVLLLQ